MTKGGTAEEVLVERRDHLGLNFFNFGKWNNEELLQLVDAVWAGKVTQEEACRLGPAVWILR